MCTNIGKWFDAFTTSPLNIVVNFISCNIALWPINQGRSVHEWYVRTIIDKLTSSSLGNTTTSMATVGCLHVAETDLGDVVVGLQR